MRCLDYLESPVIHRPNRKIEAWCYVFLCVFEGPERKGPAHCSKAGASGCSVVRVVARLRIGERLTDVSSVTEGVVLQGGWY